MPSRRPHTKSRLGCLTCKKRKVRCDLGRPVCQNCIRLEKPCAYDHSPIHTPSNLSDRTEPIPKPNDGESGQGHSSITDESAHDLELMHQWATKTSATMTDSADMYELWQDIIPKHAMSHRFLLHGILAHAALHRSRDVLPEQREFYIHLAKQHHLQGLSRYISCLKSIDQENCHSLFAFSALIGALSYGMLQVTDDEGEDFIKAVVDTFDLFKGATIIAEQAAVWIQTGDMRPLLYQDLIGSTSASPTPKPWAPRIALEALLGHVQSTVRVESPATSPQEISASQVNAVYASSIQGLLSILPAKDGLGPPVAAVFNWPATIDQTYIKLLKAREPKALILLYHYGTALQCLDSMWWLQGTGDRIHRTISARLDAEWHPYLALAT